MNRIDLNGTWHLRWSDGQRGGQPSRLFSPQADLSRALPADVPGEVHLGLIRAGLLQDPSAGLLQDPSAGLNHLSARWVEETFWHYRRTFQAPPLQPGERAYLVFEALGGRLQDNAQARPHNPSLRCPHAGHRRGSASCVALLEKGRDAA